MGTSSIFRTGLRIAVVVLGAGVLSGAVAALTWTGDNTFDLMGAAGSSFGNTVARAGGGSLLIGEPTTGELHVLGAMDTARTKSFLFPTDRPLGAVAFCGTTCSDLLNDPANCGQCGTTCNTAQGEVCDNGVCTDAPCLDRRIRCDTGDGNGPSCIDPTHSRSHCGACGRACSIDEVCVEGACVAGTTCPGTESLCPGGACVDPQTNTSHCGTCDSPCPTGQCVSGSCQRDLLHPDTCGGGAPCDQASTCGDPDQDGVGTCANSNACETGLTACGRFCVDFDNDDRHCGGCFSACAPGESCSGSVCSASGKCPTGYVDCGTGCVDILYNDTSCGACGAVCSGGEYCSGGRCVSSSFCADGGGTQAGASMAATVDSGVGGLYIVGAPNLSEVSVFRENQLDTLGAPSVHWGAGPTDSVRYGAVVAAGTMTGSGEAIFAVADPGYSNGLGRVHTYDSTGNEFGSVPGSAGEAFGAALAFAPRDVDTLAVGAPDANSGNGRVYIYALDGQLKGSVNGTSTSRFGAYLAVSNDLDANGEPDLLVAAKGTGQVYLINGSDTLGMATDYPNVVIDTASGPINGLFNVGDLDGDGADEIGVTVSQSETIQIIDYDSGTSQLVATEGPAPTLTGNARALADGNNFGSASMGLILGGSGRVENFASQDDGTSNCLDSIDWLAPAATLTIAGPFTLEGRYTVDSQPGVAETITFATLPNSGVNFAPDPVTTDDLGYFSVDVSPTAVGGGEQLTIIATAGTCARADQEFVFVDATITGDREAPAAENDVPLDTGTAQAFQVWVKLNGSPYPDYPVHFTVSGAAKIDVGGVQFNELTTLTADSGIAEVQVVSLGSAGEAGQVTADFGGDADVVWTTKITDGTADGLALVLLNGNGEDVAVGNSVTLQVKLTGNGNPLEGEAINWSTKDGNLSQDMTTTNVNGDTSVEFFPSDAGPWQVTVSPGRDSTVAATFSGTAGDGLGGDGDTNFTPYTCQSSGGSGAAVALGLSLLGLLGLGWRRRGTLLLAGLVFFAPTLARAQNAAAEKEEEAPTLAYLGVKGAAGMDETSVNAISEFVQSELGAYNVYQVLGQSEISALLGLEAQRQLMGCADDGSSCLTEIGGALGAGRLLVGNLSRVGKSVLLNLSLMDVANSKLIYRVGKRVKGETLEPVLDAIPDVVYELVSHDDLVTVPERAPTGGTATGEEDPIVEGPGAPVGAAPFVVSLRTELEVTQGGGVAGLAFGWQPGMFGLALQLVGHPVDPVAPAKTPFGIGLTGRLALGPWGPVSPYFALGATGFGGTFLARAGLGAALRFGSFHVALDANFERILTNGATWDASNLLVTGLEAGWRF